MRKLFALFATTLTLGGGGALYGADRAANPYEDKGTHYELPIVSDIPQGERVEIAKDKAAMTLVGWSDEYRITITPQIPGPAFGADTAIDRAFIVEADRPLLSQKMEFQSGDVTAFIEPRSANEFDIDFTLHAKPETNVFEYKIEGAEEFEFFYQPELTPEEIAEGAERPENVIGSFAVYHKTKANHRIGSVNYATGKAFHIYRPKAIDANGAEVWAELSYSEGVLTVTVPEKWLETAVYPVIVDPTFGYASIGVTSTTCYSDADANETSGRQGSLFTGIDGTITQVNAYINNNDALNNSDVYIAVNELDSAGANSHGLVVAGEQIDVLDGNLPGWVTVSVTPTLITSASSYIMNSTCSGTDASGAQVLRYYDFTDGPTAYFENFANADISTAYSNSKEDPWTISSAITRWSSIYATYYCESCTTTENFTTPGYASWTAPTGVSSADVACWGGGGGGADGGTSGAASGGGGAFASSTVAVSAGTQYTLFIGSGGAQTQAGTDSTFATTTVVADGGGGGAGSATEGLGGTTANSTGDVEFAGGAGADGNGTDDSGGGGGAAAGPHGAGGGGAIGQAATGGGGGGGNGGSTATTVTGGASTAGGAGGNGGTTANGSNGTSNALGGGGGGGSDNGLLGGNGGFPGGGGGGGEGTGAAAGGNGQCTITYTIAGGGGGGGGSILDQSVIWFD
jgi:hypothetical protein